MKMDLDFETWFDFYCQKVRQLGWEGNIDSDSARMDYDDGKWPEDAAKELVDELTAD